MVGRLSCRRYGYDPLGLEPGSPGILDDLVECGLAGAASEIGDTTSPIGEGREMQYLTRDGVRLAYNDAGRGDPPILLVHGMQCDHTHMQPLFDHFAGKH